MRFIRLILTRLMRGTRLIALIAVEAVAICFLIRFVGEHVWGGPIQREWIATILVLGLTLAILFGVASLLALALARLVRPEEPGEI